ncbi:alanine--tRNA ligase [Chloroflexota bacterium]
MTSDELRTKFLEYFEQRGHKIIPSSPLVPQGDSTLLLTSAGMVQFKPYFTGEVIPPTPRLASCQKCFRTTDMEQVGNFKHLTFFEMLGNFSIGDYFKKEAINWSWEFVTECLKLPLGKLWVTIFLDDDESFEHWRAIGVPKERIARCGEESNFWGPAGETGPCGPCSEIHYDLGADNGCGRPECAPDCDCGRFLEIWNLVFTEYYQDAKSKRTPLPKKNIDTGMGLERTLAAIQGKSSFYDTELFTPLIDHISKLTGRQYGQDEKVNKAMRVIAEHSRSITFLITDGVMPSNEGRGYVLRRVLRRAALFGKTLGLDKPFLVEMIEVVITNMGRVYPEIRERRDLVQRVSKFEEEQFAQTLRSGLSLLEADIAVAKNTTSQMITGEQVFKLYDTYGFPPELTAELAIENGLVVDQDRFEEEMERQRERARAAHKFGLGENARAMDYSNKSLQATEFEGYERMSCQAKVISLVVGGEFVDSAQEGQQVEVILNKTPFYAEMGGQVTDTGEILSKQAKIVITHTQYAKDLILHRGEVARGSVQLGEPVTATVDSSRRLDIARNHTTTHLLHSVLRQVLGNHVHQMGSLVTPDRLRFDFSYEAPILKKELREIQQIVNRCIRDNLAVAKREMPYSQAVAKGAIALFGEKYSDMVRVVRVGGARSPLSFEVCGGTHVNRTGDIGLLQIVSEGSVGSGMRRIEAVTGIKAETLIAERLSTVETIAQKLQTPVAEVEGKVTSMLAELDSERKRALVLEHQLSQKTAESLLSQVESVSNVSVLAAQVTASNVDVLRHIGDILRERIDSGVIVLGAVWDNRPNFLVMISPDLVERGLNAGDIAKKVSGVTGGGGGGRPQLGQGGGKDKSKINQALKLVTKLVEENR